MIGTALYPNRKNPNKENAKLLEFPFGIRILPIGLLINGKWS
jgi:hypothetical protein